MLNVFLSSTYYFAIVVRTCCLFLFVFWPVGCFIILWHTLGIPFYDNTPMQLMAVKMPYHDMHIVR